MKGRNISISSVDGCSTFAFLVLKLPILLGFKELSVKQVTVVKYELLWPYFCAFVCFSLQLSQSFKSVCSLWVATLKVLAFLSVTTEVIHQWCCSLTILTIQPWKKSLLPKKRYGHILLCQMMKIFDFLLYAEASNLKEIPVDWSKGT